jgi:threonine/homoserine/homoserine lactone efflux protein
MTLLANFIIGFFAAFIGVIPPGLLNMSAATISMKEGRKKGLLFSVGVCVTVMIQTFVALIFARFLDRHPEYVDFLQKVALGIFICITIFFFFIAKDTRRPIPDDVNRSKTNRFFKGMLLAVLNLLPIPYWVYVSITFAGFGWFTFEQPGIWATVLASGMGTFTILVVYVQFFRKKKAKPRPNVNMNYVIGFITAVISIITFIKILRNF